MSLLHANGKVQWLNADPIGTQYTISGLSFRPKAIRVWAVGIQRTTDGASTTQHANQIVGFCNEVLTQRSVAAFDQDAQATSDTGAIARNDCIACTCNGSGTSGGQLRVDSIGSDGFVFEIDVTTISANLTIFWDAWGGDDPIDVVIGDFTASGSIGTVDYTATGMIADAYDNQVLMLAGCHSTAAMNTGTNIDAGFWTGFATVGGQCVLCGNADDASGGSSDTDHYYQGGECIAIIPVGGGANTTSRASFVKWNTNGFRLDWFEAGTSGQQNIFMAIRGGSWKAGETTINTSTIGNVRTVGGLGFLPVGGLLLGGTGQALPAGQTASIDILSMGSFSGLSSSQTACQRSENTATPTLINQWVEFDEALVKATSVPDVDYALDIDALNFESFRLIITQTIGATIQWVGYLAFGDKPAANLMGQVWV